MTTKPGRNVILMVLLLGSAVCVSVLVAQTLAERQKSLQSCYDCHNYCRSLPSARPPMPKEEK